MITKKEYINLKVMLTWENCAFIIYLSILFLSNRMIKIPHVFSSSNVFQEIYHVSSNRFILNHIHWVLHNKNLYKWVVISLPCSQKLERYITQCMLNQHTLHICSKTRSEIMTRLSKHKNMLLPNWNDDLSQSSFH